MISAAAAAGAVARRNRGRNQQRHERGDGDIEGHQRNSHESVENDMDSLKSMFPSFDDEVLFMLLQQNSYQVGPTIEILLSMSATEDSTPTAPDGGTTQHPSQEEEQPAVGTFTISDEPQEEMSYYEQQALRLAGAQADDQGAPVTPAAATAESGGLDIAYAVSDEQLAFMLANDSLFQQELAAYFGEDFMIQEYMQDSQGQEGFASTAEGPEGGHGSGSDLGVVRGLTEIGSEMRSALNRFTLRYMSNNSDTGAGGGLQRQGSAGSEGSWLGGGGGAENDVELVGVARSSSGGGVSVQDGVTMDSDNTRSTTTSASDGGNDERSRLAARSVAVAGAGMGSDELGDEDDDDDMETINLLGSPMHQPERQNPGSNSIWTSFSGNARK